MDTFLLVICIVYGVIAVLITMSLMFERRSRTIRRYVGDICLGAISPIMLICVAVIFVLFKCNSKSADEVAFWLNDMCDNIVNLPTPEGVGFSTMFAA